MRRGPKPAKSREAKPPVARKSLKDDGSKVGELEKRLAEALRDKVAAQEQLQRRDSELLEALEQQTATAEVLRIIGTSPSDLQPVLDNVVKSAARFCGADSATLFKLDGDTLGVVAHHGAIPVHIGLVTPCGRGTVVGRTVLEQRAIHVTDLQAEAAEFPEGSANARRFGHRTTLSVPLLREGRAIGAIQLRRPEADRFTDKQVARLQTFADQAVIAIENVRLFTELQEKNQALTTAHARVTEALEQQTATSEILRVISESPTEVQPVFDAIVRSAVPLCDAMLGAVFRFDGELMHLAASHNYTPEARRALQDLLPLRPQRDSPLAAARAILARAVVHVPDVQFDDGYAHYVAQTGGFRGLLAVPMLREGSPIGAIFVGRRQAGPFSTAQIELLKTFADQAVIAIENVRLFNETKEALEQQTATAEILGVISSSPTDVQPVYDSIVERAARLCDAEVSLVTRLEGEWIHVGAVFGTSVAGTDAVRRTYPMRPGAAGATARAIRDSAMAHIPDVLTDPEFTIRDAALTAGFRGVLSVPMLREGHAIGAISIGRAEAGEFSAEQVNLLRTFADQAVIAIENVRLFNETKEALEQQTATAEILRVISSSPADIQPVVDAIAAKAQELCQAKTGAVFRFDGELIQVVAAHSFNLQAVEALRQTYPIPPGRGGTTARAILSRAVVYIPDIREDPEYEHQTLAKATDYLSALTVPMLHEGEAVGAITVTRAEAGAFTQRQIELLKTFADQAVIAIENVRLFNETKEALERQTATAEILSVISRSPTDVQPVFQAICQSAVRLFNAYAGAIVRFDGQLMHFGAVVSPSAEADERYRRLFPRPPDPQLATGQAILGRTIVHISDIEHEDTSEANRALGRGFGYRRLLVVPMMRDGIAIGALAVTGREPGRYSDRQIALLQTFADQAVIAIENVRLFKELQTSNRDLTTALDKQTATSDILRVISQAQTDVQPVFDAIVLSAVRLLRGNVSTLTRCVADQIELAAFTSSSDVGDAAHRARFPLRLDSEEDHAQVMCNRAPLNSADAQSDPRLPATQHESARLRGYRSFVVVPLLRHDEAIGTLGVARGEPGGFTDSEITLLQTFADQAVIAIENVRLFTELQARTQDLTRSVEQLTALGEVGRAVSSTLDLETVLTTIVSRAVELSGLDGGVIFEYDEPTQAFVQRAAIEQAVILTEARRATPIRKGEGVVGRTAVTLQPEQVADITAPGAYEGRLRETLIASGVRAVLAVPMVREDRLIGCLAVTRNRPGEFSAETIELLSTFATQSALAIQNARLFREIEEKSRQLEVASRHKSEFLANMSHELRTPLNAIIGFSEVLSERMFGELNEKQEEYSQDIHASGQHLLSLINDILDLSKIEAGRMELELTDFQLPTALDSALTLVRERAGRRGIALHLSVDERLGQMRADERKVRQVVLNLLSNAIKFTPEGGRIEVGAVAKDGFVELSVSDTGVGIASEHQEAVFEEFRQVGTAAKKVEGTGLGLTLCRKFVELHGGRIWVKSELGAGSTFTFTIPARRDE